MSMDADLTINATHGTVHEDLLDQWNAEWTHIRLDKAARAHFKRVAAEVAKPVEEGTGNRRGIADGGWIFEDSKVRVVWGNDDAPLAVEGEGLMLFGPQGVGKTTIAQQLVLALAGIRNKCLGLSVRPERGKVLYLAMDRPEQIKRSFRRMVSGHGRVSIRLYARPA